MRIVLMVILLFPFLSNSQELFRGEIANSGDNEGIHVFNKTYQKYAITDQYGKFEIPARVNDTIVFSAIQYQLKAMRITKENIKTYQYVVLEIQVNELDEVFIKPKLSGDLLADTRRIKTRDQVTAKTLNLPNADVKQPTQAERRLQTASSFDGKIGLGGSVSLDAVINAISGRTKMLKKIVANERQTKLEEGVVEEFEAVLVRDFKIPKDNIYQFVYYASSDELFEQIMKTNSYLIIYDFLNAKSKSYLKLLNSSK